MRRILPILTAFLTFAAFSVKAAMFEASPSPLQESSQNVKITFYADQSGVAGLMGLSTDLYAHIGVNTNKSPNSWSHVKTDWNENTAANTFKRISANTFELTVGDMRTYFGITDADEHITRICVIARTANGSAQTSDQFIDVKEEGFAMDFTSTPDNTVILQSTQITFTASTTTNANIKIYVDGTQVKEASSAQTLSYTQTFSTPGAQNNVKAVASNGSETLEMTIPVFYVAPSSAENYPGGVPKQGAVKNSDGSVTFCLAAPGKTSVVIVGSWDDYQTLSNRTMKYQDYQGYRYFWTTVSGLDNSTYYPYYFLVDGKYKVADPYAHLILDPHSDKWLKEDFFDGKVSYPYDRFDGIMLAVYKGDLDDYDWKVSNFAATNPIAYNNREAMVVYELLLRDFTGTNKEADGTVRQAIAKIPYLRDLGVTVVQLMPIMQFDGNNSWGYNTNCFMAPDKSYGSPDDYKEFIDKCHQNGIAVVLDIVFNHTPGLHPWYQMYDSGTSPFYNKNCPHDYGVYEDIKQEYPLVEKHWVDVLTYWLTAYKVDGFRFDLVKGLGDSNSYGSGTEAYNQSRIDRMKRLHAAMKAVNPNVIHINELLASANEETPCGNDGQLQWNNQNGNGAAYAKGENGNLYWLNSANCSRPAFSTVDYVESHDEPRMGDYAKKSSNSQLKNKIANRMHRLGSIACQLLMQPGPKMVWMFGELGDDQEMTSSNRTEPRNVSWGNLDNADRAYLHTIYTHLLWLRKDNPEMFGPNATMVMTGFSGNNAVRSIRLTNGQKEIVAFINPASPTDTSTATSGVTVSTNYLNSNNCRLVAASKGFEPTLNGTGKSVNVSVPPHSFCVFATTNIAGVDDIIADGTQKATSVYGANGEIVIKGEYNNVEVYSMDGKRVGSLHVAPGLYIVNVDGEITKVLVK